MDSIEENYIEVSILYYSGCHAYIDDAEIELEPNKQGLIRAPITVEQKQGHLLVQYEKSGMMLVCDMISLLSILGIIISIVANNK